MSWEPEIVRTIDLGYDQMMMLESQRGAVVRVVHGGVWLTEEGLVRDVFAQGGDEVALEGDGRTLVQGLGYARIEFVEPRGAAAIGRQAAHRIGRAFALALRWLRVRGQFSAAPSA